jgi:predicted dinucleotide-binding enzyme
MTIGFIGAGVVATLLAHKLTKAGHSVKLSNSRGPDTIATLIKDLGPLAEAVTIHEATQNEVVVLALNWENAQPVAKEYASALAHKVVIDVTNPYLNSGILETGYNSSEILAEILSESSLVKVFNSLYAKWIEADPSTNGGKRVAFISGNNREANNLVAGIVAQIGFAPIELGNLKTGGQLQQAGYPLAGVNLIKL